MFMKPLRDKTKGSRRQVSQARSLVAPIKGWYVGSPMADAPAGTAFLLENVFPEYDYVRLRGGSTQFASGMSGAVQTLMPYTNGVIAKLFAYCGGTIYDVTAGGANPPFVVTGLNAVAVASYVQYSGTGPQTLVVANGVDPLQFYNGTAWSTSPAWTGDVTTHSAKISFVWQYNHRLYGIGADSTDIYYPDVNAIGGPTTIFPMGPLLKLGGKLIAGGVWSQLTANGELYLWFVISSEGEIVLFSGTFPGDSGTWTQQGCYKVARPLGQNCLNTVGADVSILTEDGIIPLSKVLTLDQIALQNNAVTVYIAPAWKQAVQERINKAGWQMTFWPLKYMAVVCLPQLTAPPNIQFVANARTGAWCRYSGWDARCFAVHGIPEGKLYYGTSDGRVMLAENGGMDVGGSYTGTIFYSYSAISSLDIGQTTAGTITGQQQAVSAVQAVARKHVSMVRARFQTNLLGVNPAITINVDYDTTVPVLPPPSGTIQAGTNWDIAKWDIDLWQGAVFRQTQSWVPVYALANVVAPIIQITLKTVATPDLRLTNLDVVFETGNMFG